MLQEGFEFRGARPACASTTVALPKSAAAEPFAATSRRPPNPSAGGCAACPRRSHDLAAGNGRGGCRAVTHPRLSTPPARVCPCPSLAFDLPSATTPASSKTPRWPQLLDTKPMLESCRVGWGGIRRAAGRHSTALNRRLAWLRVTAVFWQQLPHRSRRTHCLTVVVMPTCIARGPDPSKPATLRAADGPPPAGPPPLPAARTRR